MWKRFDPSLKRVVTAALRDAAARGQSSAAVENLLVALAANPPRGANVRRDLLDEFEQRFPRLPSPPHAYAYRFDDQAIAKLRSAADLAGRRASVRDVHLVPVLLERLNGSVSPPSIRRSFADTYLGGLALRALRAPALAWNVYLRRGLGHPDYVTNPYRVYRWLREREPVRRDPIAPVWVVTSYEHTATVLKNPRFNKDPFISERLPRGAREQLGMSEAAGARSSAEHISMLFLDPPQHTRVRSIFTRAFTPRTLAALRPRIAQICDEQIDKMAASADRQADLITHLAAPLPVMIIAELLGFPPADYLKLKKWSDDMTEALGFLPSEPAKLRAARARDEMRQYFFDHVVARLRKQPDNSLLAGLLEQEARGEGLDEDELFSNSVLLLAAGHETTTNLIGNGVLALLRHPDQLRDLSEHPELIESTVEELLRYDPPVQWISRIAGEEMELGGKPLQRGQLVLGAVGAANRDPAVFADPDRFDIRRKDNKHLSFGVGIHFCLGAALARMEAEIAIGKLVARFPELKLATRRVRWRKGITFRGVESLPLRW
jgi:cytochrome P450